MTYRPGDSVTVEFITSVFSTGAAGDATGTPAGTLNKNGTDDGAVTVTVTNEATGRYKAVFTIPDTYLLGDVLNLSISATVSGVAGKGVIWHAILVEQLVQRYSKATAGGANTVTLDAAASATDSLYVGSVIEIYSGTGAGQARTCTAYNGTTKVATVGRNWVTNPASGSLCAILGLSVPKVDDNLRVDVGAISGTTQTARDLGASVLLSSGTGTGQLDFTSGVVKANLAQILGTALTETAGQIAAAFVKFFNKATPTGTINSIPDAVAGAASGLALVGSNVGAATSVSGAVGSVTGNVGGNVTGSVGSVVSYGSLVADVTAAVWAAGTRTLTSFSTLVADVAAAVWAAASRTLTAFGFSVTVGTNNDKTGYSLATAPPTANEIADAILIRDWTAVAGTVPDRSTLNALRFLRNKWSVSASTLTVTKENDVDTAWTATVSTDAAAEPIIGSDPS